MALEQKIFTARGTLKQCFEQIVPETILHADETQKRRITSVELRKIGAWVGDGVAYEFEKETGEAVLYLSRLPHNLVLNNLEEALLQLRSTGNYRPSKDAFEAMKGADSTLRIVISELELERDNGEWGNFIITTKNPEQSNPARKAVAERVHGSMAVYKYGKNKQTSDYLQVMEMLAGSIKETRIYTLTSNYVKKHAKGGAIARVCWLDHFDYNSNFNANVRYVDLNLGALRGVCREKVVAEGDAKIVFTRILGVEPIMRDEKSELTDLMITGQDAAGKRVQVVIRDYLTANGGIQHFEKCYEK